MHEDDPVYFLGNTGGNFTFNTSTAYNPVFFEVVNNYWGDGWPDAPPTGVREPRRPAPSSGSGSVCLPTCQSFPEASFVTSASSAQ